MHGDVDRQLDLLAELLVNAQHALVLTGAGVSTESGLPDYRGTDGLWRTRRFEELASIEMWRREPEEFWQFYAERLSMLSEATPNAGHHAIAELERLGLVRRVLTQNVDGLHRAAGSRVPGIRRRPRRCDRDRQHRPDRRRRDGDGEDGALDRGRTARTRRACR